MSQLTASSTGDLLKTDMDSICVNASIWEGMFPLGVNLCCIHEPNFAGGGQIFRNSLSLSVVLHKSLTIHSIRNNRPKPGLHNVSATC